MYFSFSLPLSPPQAVPMNPALTVPGAGPGLSGAEISVLLSPSAFQHSVNKAAAAATAPVVPPSPSNPSGSAGAVETPQTACSKTQLQDTLIHLIKVNYTHQRHNNTHKQDLWHL